MAVYMPLGLRRILFFYPGTLLLALANIFVGNPGDAAIWYWIGLGFTIGHVAVYGKTAVGLLNRMKDDESKGNGTVDMEAWTSMNVWRSLTVDLPGWTCYLVAALASLKA